jgi:hypothetical protein
MTEAEEQMQLAHKDDFEKLIKLFILMEMRTIPAEGSEMDSIIKRLTVVVKLHPKSKWTGDCYFDIGKAYYYKKDYEAALATFQYVSSEFKDHKATSASSGSKKKKTTMAKPMTKSEREKEEAKAQGKTPMNKKGSVFDFLKTPACKKYSTCFGWCVLMPISGAIPMHQRFLIM